MLSRIIYESNDGLFTVAEFIDSNSARRFRASGRILTIGKNSAAQQYKLFGSWEQTQKYGETFSVSYAEPARPDTLAGIMPFLINNVKGIGEITAKKLLQTLAVKNVDEFVQICKSEQDRIFAFFKSKKATALSLISLITGDEVYRAIMIFLHEHGIPGGFAQKIYDKYGGDAIALLNENPYRLISDFRNVGFLKADAIAQKLGLAKTSPFRIEAAFLYSLETASNDGHCCLPRDVLVEKARDVLGGRHDSQFSSEFVLKELRSLYKRQKESGENKLVVRLPEEGSSRSEPLFYLPDMFELENRVAAELTQLSRSTVVAHENESSALPSCLEDLEMLAPDFPWEKLSPEQLEAVLYSVRSPVMVLTGGPGCGKTFVLRAIFQVQRALERRVALCAPTGLAAKRMTASIESQASTIHKLLRLGGQPEDAFNVTQGSAPPLEGVDVVIVDESSMLSLDLFSLLLEALGPSRRLVLVGDADQLPSVGAGNCLRDIISSDRIPVVRLTKIFRQSAESPIPIAAREIISGQKPGYSAVCHSVKLQKPEAFAFVPCAPSTFYQMLIPFVRETIPQVYGLDPVRDCQILVPMRKSEVGQENLNKILQQELNPPRDDKEQTVMYNQQTFRVGDKIIQTKNNYDKEVFNGDLGYCKSIRKSQGKVEIVAEFTDRTVTFEDDEADDLQLCYAMTIHKSQGSEFPLCIIPMFGSYFTMLDRNLLYTAVTRASRYVILFGEDWAIKKAVNSMQAQQRFTALESLLKSNIEADAKKRFLGNS